MKVKISSVRIGKRVRKDLGDIQTLKNSMAKYGLIHPIMITSVGNLITGFRRLQAAKQLGWNEIEATVFDPVSEFDLLEIEIDENLARKDFTLDEVNDGILKKKKFLNPNLFAKIWRFILRLLGIKS